MIINKGKTVFIDPGTVIKLGWPSSEIYVEGDLEVLGTEANKVYFTSLHDDTVGGDTNANVGNSWPQKRDWQAITFEAGSKGTFKNSVLRYGGENTGTPGIWPVIYNRGGDITLEDTYIGHNFSDGIYQSSGTTTVARIELVDQSIGARASGGSMDIHQSLIRTNV